MGERVQGGRLAARAIAAEGVDVVFTLSGGHVMPIYEGCRQEGVRVIDVRHEQSAAHAAEAWGRVGRSCGVALVTAGPGVTGTVTAVASCFAAQAPLVVLGGARPLAQAEWGALQEFDQLALMRPITKWAAVCPSTARIPEYVAIAFRHALAPPRGPVYLELPADILFDEADARAQGPARAAPRAFGDPRELLKAADLLNRAERPAVVAGSGMWWDDAAKQLASFAENGHLPTYLNGSGRGSLPPGHELFFQHSRSTALEQADVVCVIGAPLDFRLRYGRFGAEKLIHVHGDPRELGRNRVPDAAIVGDCAAVLGILADGVKAPADGRAAWLGSLRETERAWWDAHGPEIHSDASPIHHYRLGRELDRALDPDTVVIGDGGDVVAAVSRVLRVHRPGHWLDPGPFGCLGVGPGYAMAAKLAEKITKGKGFDFADLREQLSEFNRMGGIQALASKLPNQALPPGALAQVDEKAIRRQVGIIDSMTPGERRRPAIIAASRKRRIAAGAGVPVQEVNRLLKQFMQMEKVMKKMKGGGLRKLMRGLSGALPGGRGPR